MPDVVSMEVADADFIRMCEANRLEIDEEEMSEKEAKDFTKQRQRIGKAIRSGRLTVGDDGCPTVLPGARPDGLEAKPVVFKMSTGAALLAIDAGKDGDIHKSFAVAENLTGSPKGLFSKLHSADATLCSLVAALLAGAE